jgi:Tol biopolymer transport system component
MRRVAYGAPMHLVGEVAPVSRLAPAIGLWIAALLALVLAPVAHATYPGENGKIYFSALCEGCNQYDIYSVNPDGSGLENVTDVVTDGPDLPDSAYDPSVSADGKRMAFAVDSQATAQIWIMNTDGTGALQLTNDEMIDQQPTLSPDGSKIVWNHWPEFFDRDIWVMNSDGSGKQSFYDGSAEDYYPRFTPDGQTIVMQSETGDMDIRKVPFTPMVPPLSTSTGVADSD